MKSGLMLFICLFIFISIFTISAQSGIVDLSEIDLETVDFSNARLSVAGPGAFLIRNVEIEDDSYSVIFKERDGSWVVVELIAETGNPVLPDNVVLDFATVTITENGLQIDGILIDGVAYSTVLNINNEGLTIPQSLSAAKLVGSSLSRVNNDAGLYTSNDISSQSARIASLTERNTELIAEVGDLGLQVTSLAEENTQLEEQLAQLKLEKETLNTEVLTLQTRVTELNTALAETEAELSESLAALAEADGNAVTITAVNPVVETVSEEDALDDTAHSGTDTNRAETSVSSAVESRQFDLLLNRIEVLLEKIEQLENQIVSLETEIANVDSSDANWTAESTEISESAAASNYLVRIEELEAEITDLRIENSRLSAERNEIEQEVRRQFLEEGYIATIRSSLTEIRQKGFSMSETQIGDWEIDGRTASQINPAEFFAKLELPVPQDERPTLYSFEARSRGQGWVGFGVHIFADGVDKKGYGYGESLLLWFTRDPEEYGNDQTYLEIYRSSDDINMARVLSAAIPESVEEWMDIDLLYQPGDEYLTVAVNGVEKLRYKTWFGINWGVQMALRTLDIGEFRNLEVRTTEGEVNWP